VDVLLDLSLVNISKTSLQWFLWGGQFLTIHTLNVLNTRRLLARVNIASKIG
jgi:hypothetical protein